MCTHLKGITQAVLLIVHNFSKGFSPTNTSKHLSEWHSTLTSTHKKNNVNSALIRKKQIFEGAQRKEQYKNFKDPTLACFWLIKSCYIYVIVSYRNKHKTWKHFMQYKILYCLQNHKNVFPIMNLDKFENEQPENKVKNTNINTVSTRNSSFLI